MSSDSLAAVQFPASVAAARPAEPSLRFGWRTFAVMILIAAAAAAQPWKKLRSESLANGAAENAVTTKTVTVARPQPAAAAEIVLPATIRPWQTTTLHARVSGYLASWNKDLGATVKAGEVLATIETPELDQEVAEADATAKEAAAAALQARAERVEAESDLQFTEAQLTRAQAEADLAGTLLARREKLLVTQAISVEEHDTFRKQMDARTAEVRAAESDVARRRSNLETRTAIIAAREATAQSKLANVERLKELQSFKRIVAPFDGVITRRSAEVGMLVTAGKESLFTVEDMHRVRVQVNVPQTFASQTEIGSPATVHVPEAIGAAVVGAVTRVAHSVDSTNRTMLAEIEIENSAGRFQPGSYAQVGLSASADAKSWTVPTNTLQMRVEGPHVAVVNERDEIELRRVQLGRDLGNRVVTLDGIRGDERLVVNPGDDLTSGTAVLLSGTPADREAAHTAAASQNAAFGE